MKAVVNDFIIQKNKLGQAVTPIYLYSILYDPDTNAWLRFNSSATDITFDGIIYEKEVISHSSIKENASGLLDRIGIEIGNANREMQYYLDNYDGLKDKKCLITLVWKEAINNPLCFLEHEYVVESSSADREFAQLVLSSAFDTLDLVVPRRIFSRTRCQVAQFKDEDCGYSGGVSSCDRTYETCEALGNLARFGGFPGVPMAFQGFVE